MRFLDRNQYCIWFSSRCNYSCSYCINHSVQGGPRSKVEKSPHAIIRLFETLDPGVITVSGGEPLLWEWMPVLIETLPMHYWVILTNLSSMPDWLKHERVKLVIAAYHEQAQSWEFLNRLKQLPRPVVKLLSQPGDEEKDKWMWDRCWTHEIPAHFVPIEWPRGFDEDFLHDLLHGGENLTSLMYSSRFFSKPVEMHRLCPAGTREMFQMMPSGDFGRCSQAGAIQGTLFDPIFNEAKMPCSLSCYCEWHHWADVTMATDNMTWDRYVNEGQWRLPTSGELWDFLERMGWS